VPACSTLASAAGRVGKQAVVVLLTMSVPSALSPVADDCVDVGWNDTSACTKPASRDVVPGAMAVARRVVSSGDAPLALTGLSPRV